MRDSPMSGHDAGEEARRSAADAKHIAKQHQAAESARAGGEAPGDVARQTAEDVGRQASDAAKAARDQAEKLAEQGKTAGADRMEGVARAARSAADDLEQQSPEAARYVRQAADKIEKVSSSVRGRSIDEIFDMVNDFAHRQPAAVFGGAVLAGFALTRFAKSSSARAERANMTNAAAARSGDGGVRHADEGLGTDPFPRQTEVTSTGAGIAGAAAGSFEGSRS